MKTMVLLGSSVAAKVLVAGTLFHAIWKVSHIHGVLFFGGYVAVQGIDWLLSKDAAKQEQLFVKNFVDNHAKQLGGGNA